MINAKNLLLLLFLSSCFVDNAKIEDRVEDRVEGRVEGAERLKIHLDNSRTGDLDAIIKKKYIRILTTKNAYDYYIYQGQTVGIQYEMAKEFTKHLNSKYVGEKQLRIVFEMIPVEFDLLIPMLNEGKGDIIAVGLTQTPKRLEQVEFTVPYRVVDDVIVTRKEFKNQSWKNKTFHVQKDSSYFAQLKLKNENMKIKRVDPNFNGANIMEFISLKKYDYTLVNSFWAKTISKRFSNLHIIKDNPYRKKVEVSWAVRKNNSKLLEELNTFLPKIKKGTLLGNLLSYKYI